MNDRNAEDWGRAASIISDASGVTVWFGEEEQERAISRALANHPNDQNVLDAVAYLRAYPIDDAEDDSDEDWRDGAIDKDAWLAEHPDDDEGPTGDGWE